MIFEYVFLFFSAFTSATILPGSSEIVFVGLLHDGGNGILLLLIASLGNTFGSVVNWLLGKYFLRYKDKNWFPVSGKSLLQSQGWFSRYGVWCLFFSWLPLIGDALSLVAGMMRTRFYIFFVLTLIGKSARYIFLYYVYLGLF